MFDRETQLSWIQAATAVAILAAGGALVVLEGGLLPEASRTFGHVLTLAAVAAVLIALAGVALFVFASRRLFDSIEEHQEQIRAIVETAPDGIITTDEKGVVRSFNAAAERMFGCRAPEVIGSYVTVLLSGADTDTDSAGFTGFLREYRIRLGAVNELRGLRRNGESFPMELSLSCTDFDAGLVFTLLCRDVTERVQAEQDLHDAHALLEERVKARTAELEAANKKLHKEIAARKQLEETRQKLLADLKEALARVKILGGLIPICANCKKVRDDQGYWKQIEGYVRDHSYASFSHGICPDCMRKLYPDVAAKLEKNHPPE
jgi:PAS domain S-box-containing protein